MGVRAIVVAALAALVPAAASAQAGESPSWSIGAGVGFLGERVFLMPSGSVAGLFLSGGSFVPVATFFVERRVGEQTWLVFGAEGSVTRNSIDPLPDTAVGMTTQTKDDSEQASVSIGLRRVVTRPGAPVDVSLQATVEGGYFHELQEFTPIGAATSDISNTGRYAAVTGGIAVERELTGGLALRISTPLVGASWSKVDRRDDLGTRAASTTSAFVTLAPRLELRLAF